MDSPSSSCIRRGSYQSFLFSILPVSTPLPSSCGTQQDFHLPSPWELRVTELTAEAGFETDSNMLFFWLPHILCKLSGWTQLIGSGITSTQPLGGSTVSPAQEFKKGSNPGNSLYHPCFGAAQAHLHLCLWLQDKPPILGLRE